MLASVTTDTLELHHFSLLSCAFSLSLAFVRFPVIMKLVSLITSTALVIAGTEAFAPSVERSSSTTALQMGMFDFERFSAFGSANKDDLDEQWEAQQEILRNRRKPQADRDAYFEKVAEKRAKASKKQNEMWGWQTKNYAKGEDPLNEWKKRRADGTISDLNDQYGDPKKIGGIPLPSASFGVGGEFGVSVII